MAWEELEKSGIKAYYKDDAVFIINADCREVLPFLPKVDLVLTDPPYGISKKHKGETFLAGDTINLLPKTLPLLYRNLKDNGGIFIFAATKLLHETLWQFQTYFKLHNIIIWDKVNARYPYQKSNFWRQYEPIIYGSKGLFELADGKHSDIMVFPIDNPMANDRYMTVQKPKELVTNILQATKGSVLLILDPFLGSGTTAFCAKKLNRKCIGIEIEERYCEIAAKRCAQGVFNLGL